MSGLPIAERAPAPPSVAAPERSSGRLAGITPNWFASVMGTGIVAVAAARPSYHVPGLHTLAITAWLLAAALLIALTVATVARARVHPGSWRADADDPVMVHFYGAVPMAVLTVGAATLFEGGGILGSQLAVDVDWALWIAGTVAGLATATAVPYLTFTRHRYGPESAFGGWLMPIVPPMVSASTGALLLPYAAAGQLRLDLLLCCYGMFGASLLASVIVITLIWHRLAIYGPGEARLIPTLWIVLGPLGQSVTAANLLGADAHLALPSAEASVLRTVGIIYGLPVLGFALLWAVIAGAITLRTARAHLPFSLTWWSFTFPVGTCATGAAALAVATGSTMLRVGEAVAFVALTVAWVTVGVRTAQSFVAGTLTSPPPRAS
jgi:C4-dicarboxylate transporter/malic acid transport protein